MLAKITDGGTFTNWGTNIGGKLGIDITPVNGLKISAAVAPNFNNVKEEKLLSNRFHTPVQKIRIPLLVTWEVIALPI